MRIHHKAGERRYVDFAGKRMEVIDPRMGEVTKVQTFVATMGGSNYTYVEAVPDSNRLSFLDRLTLLLNCEIRALNLRLRRAKLHQAACMEDIDYRTPRGLNQQQMLQLTSCGWIRRRLNVILTGPTGTGKKLSRLCAGSQSLSGRLQRRLSPLTSSPGRIEHCAG